MKALHLEATSIAINVEGYPPLYQSVNLGDDIAPSIVVDELSDHNINTVVASEYGKFMAVGELIYSHGNLWIYVNRMRSHQGQPITLMHVVEWSRIEGGADETDTGKADAAPGQG